MNTDAGSAIGQSDGLVPECGHQCAGIRLAIAASCFPAAIAATDVACDGGDVTGFGLAAAQAVQKSSKRSVEDVCP